MRWRELTEAERAGMSARVRQEQSPCIAVLAFDGRFCKRPRLVQLFLFAGFVCPACRTPCEAVWRPSCDSLGLQDKGVP